LSRMSDLCVFRPGTGQTASHPKLVRFSGKTQHEES
jgi:hypothetical protein